jgi:rubrerythrin
MFSYRKSRNTTKDNYQLRANACKIKTREVNMCSVGDSFGVELEEGVEPHDYVCNQCGKKFKGIGTNLRCPKCHSTDNKCVE